MIPTDFDTTDYQESLVDIIASLVSNTKASVLMQPRQAAFHHPAVNPKPAAIFSAALSEQGNDSLTAKLSSVRFTVISPIAKNRIRTLKRSAHLACNCRNALNQRQQLRYIMAVSASQSDRKGNTVGVRYHMMFRAFLAAIRGVGACFCPPKTARTEAESTIAREKSIWSTHRSLFSSIRWILSHTPARCQSCRRRQQVIPEPQPISWGRSSQPMPVFSTNRMPVKAARSGMRFRPGYRNLRFFFGINGSMISHNSSLTICFAMSSLHAFLRNIQLLISSDMNIKNLSFC